MAGRTGMGKTRLKMEIVRKKTALHPHLNVYHLDTKKRGDYTAHNGVIYTGDKAPDAYRSTGGNRMVWQPIDDDKTEYSKFFTNILNAGLPAIVDIDECINMNFGKDEIPRGLKILLAQGRLPGIHVYGGTQEVARSPRQMLSQARYIISFALNNRFDETSMLHYLRLKNGERTTLGLKRFQFYHIDIDNDGEAKLYNSFEELKID